MSYSSVASQKKPASGPYKISGNGGKPRVESKVAEPAAKPLSLEQTIPAVTYHFKWVMPNWSIPPSVRQPLDEPTIVVFRDDMTIGLGNDSLWAEGCTYEGGTLRGERTIDRSAFEIVYTVGENGKGRVTCSPVFSVPSSQLADLVPLDPPRIPPPSWTAEEGG